MKKSDSYWLNMAERAWEESINDIAVCNGNMKREDAARKLIINKIKSHLGENATPEECAFWADAYLSKVPK